MEGQLTKIYGASDDLIEIDGPCSEEIGCYDHKKPIKIETSDGTKATIFYGGEWKINVISAGPLYADLIPSVGDTSDHTGNAAGLTSYSDVLILKNGIEWVKVGRKTIRK